ncbi:MAG: acyl-CoA dehydratase activase-related protein, partial [Bacteroidetes bacterium]|nr:acyl-CoA dehydratase activase-related protein [Bacteroidota bacterium]
MLVAAVQTRPRFGEPASNVRQAITMMENAPAEIYVLPELCTSGYVFAEQSEVEKLAEPIDGPSIKTFVEFAARRGVYVVAGFAERAERIYNSSALIGPEGVIGVYRKIHLFDRENLFFAPGDKGFPVFETRFGKVGMMICFDWFFPESARSLALGGADIIAHPSNLVLPFCPDAMVTRCLENRVFAITANRVGEESRGGHTLSFIGQSEIVRPDGVIVKRLGGIDPGVAMADIDLARARHKRLNAFNDLIASRRLEQYRYDDERGETVYDNSIKGEPIGVPKILNMWEMMPFWKAFLTELGFSPVFSDPTNKKTI